MIDFNLIIGCVLTNPDQESRIVKSEVVSYKPATIGTPPDEKYIIEFKMKGGHIVIWEFNMSTVRDSVLEKLDKEFNAKTIN